MNIEKLRDGAYGLSSLSKKTGEYKHLQMYKGSTFSSVILRPQRFGPAGVELTTWAWQPGTQPTEQPVHGCNYS